MERARDDLNMFLVLAVLAIATRALALRAAVCLTGQGRGVASFTLPTIKRHLVEVLAQNGTQVVTFVAGDVTRVALDAGGWGGSTQVLASDTTEEELRRLVREANINLTAHWWPSNPKASKPAVPLITDRFGSKSLWGWLCQLNQTASCLRAIHEHETTQGFVFDVVARARLDALWFLPLQPGALQAALQGKVVVPSEHNWFGVNDRFVLCKRRDFDVYASLFNVLVSPSKQGASALPWPPQMNAETALATYLKSARLDVLAKTRFLPFCHVSLAQTHKAKGCPVCKNGDEGISALPTAAQRTSARKACGLGRGANHLLRKCQVPSAERELCEHTCPQSCPTAQLKQEPNVTGAAQYSKRSASEFHACMQKGAEETANLTARPLVASLTARFASTLSMTTTEAAWAQRSLQLARQLCEASSTIARQTAKINALQKAAADQELMLSRRRPRALLSQACTNSSVNMALMPPHNTTINVTVPFTRSNLSILVALKTSSKHRFFTATMKVISSWGRDVAGHLLVVTDDAVPLHNQQLRLLLQNESALLIPKGASDFNAYKTKKDSRKSLSSGFHAQQDKTKAVLRTFVRSRKEHFVCYFDDDMYVNVPNLKLELYAHATSDRAKHLLSSTSQLGKLAPWSQGGWCASRDTAMRIVEELEKVPYWKGEDDVGFAQYLRHRDFHIVHSPLWLNQFTSLKQKSLLLSWPGHGTIRPSNWSDSKWSLEGRRLRPRDLASISVLHPKMNIEWEAMEKLHGSEWTEHRQGDHFLMVYDHLQSERDKAAAPAKGTVTTHKKGSKKKKPKRKPKEQPYSEIVIE